MDEGTVIAVGPEVEEYSPMKRGLKVYARVSKPPKGQVEEYSPMKRGLKEHVLQAHAGAVVR